MNVPISLSTAQYVVELVAVLAFALSGIIEAASFGTPVVNVGWRQNLRERNANTADSEADPAALAAAIGRQLARGRYPAFNVYGDGQAGRRIVEVLAGKTIDSALMHKFNGY
jgi:GDP/UDP-N,N'-diacetylbacillosamine 2-epimerase (hydrolysing)